MTERTEIAVLILQGFCSSHPPDTVNDRLVADAFRVADLVLAEENRRHPTDHLHTGYPTPAESKERMWRRIDAERKAREQKNGTPRRRRK